MLSIVAIVTLVGRSPLSPRVKKTALITRKGGGKTRRIVLAVVRVKLLLPIVLLFLDILDHGSREKGEYGVLRRFCFHTPLEARRQKDRGLVPPAV